MNHVATMQQSNRDHPLSRLVAKSDDQFYSKYFDRQISYRYLFHLSDGHQIESTAYEHFLKGEPTDLAIDISTMVGCPVGCRFCESAMVPYVRRLTKREIISQVKQLVEEHDVPKFPKIVCSFQGIGEPSLLAKSVLETSKYLIDLDDRIVISISTAGACLDALDLWRRSEVPIENLQISLCGTTDRQIKKLIPRLATIDDLLIKAKLCSRSENFKKVKFNYILIKDVNDLNEDVGRLISIFKEIPITIKISALNHTMASHRHRLRPANVDRAQQICHELTVKGIDAFVFGSFSSINFSCGQLAFVRKGADR